MNDTVMVWKHQPHHAVPEQLNASVASAINVVLRARDRGMWVTFEVSHSGEVFLDVFCGPDESGDWDRPELLAATLGDSARRQMDVRVLGPDMKRALRRAGWLPPSHTGLSTWWLRQSVADSDDLYAFADIVGDTLREFGWYGSDFEISFMRETEDGEPAYTNPMSWRHQRPGPRTVEELLRSVEREDSA